MAVSVALVGDKRLARKLDELAGPVSRRILREGIRKALTPINRAAKRKAPKRTGLLKKAIGKKVVVKPGYANGIVGVRTGFKQIIGGEPRDPNNYAHFVEYGTPHSAAKPFLRPAMDENRDKAFRIIRDVAREKIKTAARKR